MDKAVMVAFRVLAFPLAVLYGVFVTIVGLVVAPIGFVFFSLLEQEPQYDVFSVWFSELAWDFMRSLFSSLKHLTRN